MNADKVEHRGFEAFQSVYNDTVLIVKDGAVVHTIRTNDKRKTTDELKAMIEEYIRSE